MTRCDTNSGAANFRHQKSSHSGWRICYTTLSRWMINLRLKACGLKNFMRSANSQPFNRILSVGEELKACGY